MTEVPADWLDQAARREAEEQARASALGTNTTAEQERDQALADLDAARAELARLDPARVAAWIAERDDAEGALATTEQDLARVTAERDEERANFADAAKQIAELLHANARVTAERDAAWRKLDHVAAEIGDDASVVARRVWSVLHFPAAAASVPPPRAQEPAPEFVLYPPRGWLGRIDEVLRWHGAATRDGSHVGMALARLIRSWEGTAARDSDTAPGPGHWGPRAAAAVPGEGDSPAGAHEALQRAVDALGEILRGPWHAGHPGYPALRTYWTREETVQRWREAHAAAVDALTEDPR